MSRAEYWLYTNTIEESSCITSLEMLMSQVICMYYPNAGLNDTIGKYGISVNPGSEVEAIMHLTTEKKELLKKTGREYAMSCSWENRAKEWTNLLGLCVNKKRWAFYCSDYFEKKMIRQYIDNLNNI